MEKTLYAGIKTIQNILMSCYRNTLKGKEGLLTDQVC